MSYEKVPTALEIRVVSMIARGDSYPSIREKIEREFGRTISAGVITAIKKRNQLSIDSIKMAVMEKEKHDAIGILARSHRMIGKQLQQAEENEETVKFTDLVAISKEMHAQVKAEKEPDDAARLGDPKEKLKQLQSLLEENDEIRLERIIFAKRDATTEVHSTPNEDERPLGDEAGHLLQGPDLHNGSNTDSQETQDPTAP